MQNQFIQPAQKTNKHFTTFLNELIVKYQPKQIYSFGAIFQINSVNDCLINPLKDEDYHLLLVTESNTRFEHNVQEFANCHYGGGKITILTHGSDSIAEAVKANNRFFITVLNHAEMIYCKEGSFPLHHMYYTPAQTAIKVQKHFTRRLELLSGFLISAIGCLNNLNYKLCVFMAHQVIEQCCIALIWVHLGYRSNIHNLERLLNLCNCFSSAPARLILSDNVTWNGLLQIIMHSYTEARYNDNFNVDKQTAERVIDCVSAFAALTNKMCGKKISELSLEADCFKQKKEKANTGKEINKCGVLAI
jgi:HEPN domain-containing protein